MPDHNKELATTFMKAWSPEFEKSVEMFSGLLVTIQPGGEAKPQQLSGEGNPILWQVQALECGVTGSVWIGTPASTRLALTETLADNAESRDSLYKELLRQSLEGAAHILSPGADVRMTCKKALEDGSPPDLADTNVAWVKLPEREPEPILVGFQSDFMALMLAVERASAEDSEAPEPKPASPTERVVESNLRIDRLIDLELPIAVVIGRARLRVQDALKLTAGSLVELDRRAGDSVEIVVHNAVVARGEVVSVGGNYGVKIREVISRSERAAIQTSASPGTRGTVQRP
jgi:flagellar motor switch protein FliN/FliY